MGGKEGAKGYLYQACVSVLEALLEEKWDKIYIELDTKDEKVDIALEYNGLFTKSIQVKSTMNTFSKNDIKNWLISLIEDDIGATNISLELIGQFNKDAISFMNSIEKFQNNIIDKTVTKDLANFDTNIIKGKNIHFSKKFFDIDIFMQIIRDSLHKYTSKKGIELSFKKIDFVASGLVFDQIISSTHGRGVTRKEFEEKFDERIKLISTEIASKRIDIGITSFSRSVNKSMTNHLSLVEKFDGRKIKDEYDWNIDIYESIKSYIYENTDIEKSYQISLNTHASIAFAAGRILDSKSGIDVFPIQRSITGGTCLWDVNLLSKKEYSKLNFSTEVVDENQSDVVLILNITHDIYDDVIEYTKSNGLNISRIINCEFDVIGTGTMLIEDGTHAQALARSIYEATRTRTVSERKGILHIFASAPNSFMFFLGKHSRGFGKCLLYEFDFTKYDSCSYQPSIIFID